MTSAETTSLTLEQCRELALRDNTSSKIDQESKAAAEDMRKAALAAMFPSLSANAAYTYKTGETHLLANTSDFSFGSITAYDENGEAVFHPNDPLFTTPPLSDIEEQAGQLIADAYQSLYDRLSPDMRHIAIAQIGITQPIYVGGRLREMYRLAQSAERIVDIQQAAHQEDVIVHVDECFWRVVSVEQKKTLAENYLQLLTKLEEDVTVAAEAGLLTQADLYAVKVKKSDAETKLMQATNGLILSKMALCQACGLPLETDVHLTHGDLSEITLHPDTFDAASSVKQRSEILLLDEAAKIAESQAKMAAASLQPNIVASANYVYTNPNVEDGFSSDWKGKGFFTAGVVMNIPIAHADDIYRYRSAKHTAKIAQLRKEEAEQLLTLQATQSHQKVIEATQKLQLAQTSLQHAEQNLRYAQELFAAGMITTSEVLQSQTAWLAAHTDLIEAQVEVQMAETYFKKSNK